MKIFKSVDLLNNALKKIIDNGKRIVFTNGVFDIIHPGHIELLEFAKDSGDILIVGINTDESIKRLKGQVRPIFPLAERMEILSAIEYIDYIIPFSEDTPLELIQGLIKIDTLIKGGDYTPDKVVGKKEVEGKGGRLLLFQFKSNYSTSSIIDKIQNKNQNKSQDK